MEPQATLYEDEVLCERCEEPSLADGWFRALPSPYANDQAPAAPIALCVSHKDAVSRCQTVDARTWTPLRLSTDEREWRWLIDPNGAGVRLLPPGMPPYTGPRDGQWYTGPLPFTTLTAMYRKTRKASVVVGGHIHIKGRGMFATVKRVSMPSAQPPTEAEWDVMFPTRHGNRPAPITARKRKKVVRQCPHCGGVLS